MGGNLFLTQELVNSEGIELRVYSSARKGHHNGRGWCVGIASIRVAGNAGYVVSVIQLRLVQKPDERKRFSDFIVERSDCRVVNKGLTVGSFFRL